MGSATDNPSRREEGSSPKDLDGLDAPRPPRPPRAPSRRTWIGLGALALLALALVLPIDRLRRARPRSTPLVTAPASATPRPRHDEAAESLGVAASLASAAGALAQIESLRHQAPRPPLKVAVPRGPFPDPPAHVGEAPPPSSFDSPTACMATYLPEVEVGSRSLDFICRHTEMWGVERKAYPRIAPRGGAGATMWKNLGSYSLAALAMMRAGCCEGAEPLLAVVPGLWCGILRDKLRALGPMPDEAAFDDYAETMTCLEERGVRVPERWHGPTDEARRDAMRAFLQNAWRRGDIAPP